MKDNITAISMGNKSQDNAYAERINRTIKEEYLQHWKPTTFTQLRRQLTKAVNHYNEKRPHKNISNLTPTEFIRKWDSDPTFNKPVITIFDDNLI